MKTLIISFIMLMGGCSALLASDKNPVMVNLNIPLKAIKIFILGSESGTIRLRCNVSDVKIIVKSSSGVIVFENKFLSEESLDINVQSWEEGEYTYDIVKDNTQIKSGVIKVNNFKKNNYGN